MSLPIEHKTLSNSGQWWVVMEATGVSGGTITVYEGTQQETELLIGTHFGPYSSLADANKEAATLQNNNQTVAGSIKAGAAGPLSGLAAIGDFFQRLTQANTWMRVGEVVVGLILLGIGVNALFKGAPMKAITGTAGTVGKVIP